jgi:hypothetical protein
LLLRVLDVARTQARADWRPDLLELIADPWLEGPIGQVREALADVERLTDSQITAQIQSMARQLRATRLSTELPELAVLAQDAEPDVLAQVKARIGQIAVELAALRKQASDAPRGPNGLGAFPPMVPARFRAVDVSRPVAGAQSPRAPDAPVVQLTVEPPEAPPFEEPDEIDFGAPDDF